MEDKKVSRETAVLAKEKRFKELTSHYYLDKDVLMEKGFIVGYPLEQDYEVDFENLFDYFNNKYKRDGKGNSCFGCNNKKYQESFSAPTQSLLQKWLREKCGLVVDVVNYFSLTKFALKIHTFEGGKYVGTVVDSVRDISNKVTYKTYEEALEIGLQEALKLIENEKTNNDE